MGRETGIVNDEQLAFWSDYVRYVADHIGLRDHRIDVSRDSASPHCHAEVHTTTEQNFSVIRLNTPHFFGLDAERQRQIVLHELLHIHFTPFTDNLDIYLEGHDSEASALIRRLMHRDAERTTDNFSSILTPLVLTPQVWAEQRRVHELGALLAA